MKVCYVDETGTDGISPVLVMVGVIADGQRLPKTQSELAAIFGSLGNLSAKTLRELKSTQLFKGTGPGMASMVPRAIKPSGSYVTGCATGSIDSP